MSAKDLEDALDVLRDTAMQLQAATGTDRTLLQQKILNRAMSILEKHGKDASFLKQSL